MLKMAQRLLHKVFVFFLPLFSPQGGGDIPVNSWWGCAARFSKSSPHKSISNSHITLHFLLSYNWNYKYVHTAYTLLVPSKTIRDSSQTKMCKVYTLFQTENHTLWGNTYMHLFDGLYKVITPLPYPLQPERGLLTLGRFGSIWIHAYFRFSTTQNSLPN